MNPKAFTACYPCTFMFIGLPTFLLLGFVYDDAIGVIH